MHHPMINTANMNIDERAFLLADVTDGTAQIGVTAIAERSDIRHINTTDVMFADNEPLVVITGQSRKANYADKMYNQCSGMSDIKSDLHSRLAAAAEGYFTQKQPMSRAVMPLLETLTDGLYVVHESTMLPTDGAGNFFWLAYTQRHEVTGSSDYNNVIGRNNNYEPCFLVPTTGAAGVNHERLTQQRDRIKNGRNTGGVAYHLSGLFSALLYGHHAATASLTANAAFKCIVIEPVHDVIYNMSDEDRENPNRSQKPEIIALACPYVKIPLDSLPERMLENFLLRRRGIRPDVYTDLKDKLTKVQRPVSKRSFPPELFEHAETLPDVAMYESAALVAELSEEQLQALLRGETKYQDKVIISNNFYNSIVTACNFLQYKDFDRFITFVIDILRNPDLAATHKYIAERLLGVMNPIINSFFLEVTESGTSPEISGLAEKYVSRYKERADTKEEKTRKHEQNTKRVMRQTKQSLESLSESGLEKMREAAHLLERS